MSESPSAPSDLHADLAAKLTKLINKYYKHILANVKDHAKLGDLLKMIELKLKLLPDNSDQKQFWKMMQEIRREKLPAKRTPTGADFQPVKKQAKEQ